MFRGSICGHNVAITCLPGSGTENAAVVAKDIHSTFTGLKETLLVGIGGGVPRPGVDIRLGDVVVSKPTSEHPAILRYDYGKAEASGFVQNSAVNQPSSSILQAVALLESKHSLQPSSMSSYITTAITSSISAGQMFRQPEPEMDVLFNVGCEHTDIRRCNDCGPSAIVMRKPRQFQDPVVHYGTVGSGNELVKHGRTRDARSHGNNILCFEMEAAGVVKVLPSLVIRGICDYCDTHKHKHFQKYAALVAAAYAKELLSTMTPPARENGIQYIEDTSEDDHCKLIMDLLHFPNAETQKEYIMRAHRQTCEWLTENHQYFDWLKLEGDGRNRGLIWLKGKPGAGKSTAMRFLIEHVQKRPSTTVISFFYKAGKDNLASSTDGMYRSLIYQILTKKPHLQTLLKDEPIPNEGRSFSTKKLQNLFKRVVESFGPNELFCFIDALDECHHEDQIGDMLEVFEELSQLVDEGQLRFHTCFSSRHYPNLAPPDANEITLQLQSGHLNDIVSYIEAKLAFNQEPNFAQIKAKIVKKSGGVFLWVHHAVRILEREYLSGRIQSNTLQKLEEISPDLETLFQNILRRDSYESTNAQTDLQTLFKWILYAKRPLSKDELYYALSQEIEVSTEPLIARDQVELVGDTQCNYLLHLSRGLLELTATSYPVFIHESLRTLLLQPGGLQDIGSGFDELQQARCHETLKKGCNNYLTAVKTAIPAADLQPLKSFREEVDHRFPLLEYSTNNVLFHAEHAEQAGCDQTSFLQDFATNFWMFMHNLHSSWRTGYYSVGSTLTKILVNESLTALLVRYLNYQNTLDATSWDDVCDIVHSCRGNNILFNIFYNATAVQSILGHGRVKDYFEAIQEVADDLYDRDYIDIRNLLKNAFDWTETTSISGSRQSSLDKALHVASQRGYQSCAALLLKHAANVDNTNEHGRTPLYQAVQAGNLEVVKCLLDGGSQVNFRDDNGMTPLMCAAASPSQEIRLADTAKLLLDHRADVDILSKSKKSALHFAVEQASDTLVELLMSSGANWNVVDGAGRTPLDLAAMHGKLDKTQILMRHGAHVSGTTSERSLLHLAAKQGRTELCQFLLAKGLSPNMPDSNGITPMHCAMHKAPDELVMKLVGHGAQAELRNGESYSPLHRAARSGNTAALRTVLDQGVQVDAKSEKNNTALFFAAQAGHDRAVELLLDRGADIENIKGVKIRRWSTKRLLLAHGTSIGRVPDFQDYTSGDGNLRHKSPRPTKSAFAKANGKLETNGSHEAVKHGKKSTTSLTKSTRAQAKQQSIEQVLDRVDLPWLYD